MKLKLLIALFLSLFSLSDFFAQQLMINELSQGPGGLKEYVEFVVIGNPICEGDPVPCIDIRKVIFDDNNGFFASSGSVGIAPGALRFSNDDFWSCIPQGTYIVIYNEDDINPAVGEIDTLLNDGNCKLVLPGDHRLLEATSVSPTSSNPAYPTDDNDWNPSLGWQGAGIEGVLMSNSNDSFQIPDLSNNGTPLHAISWGNNTNGTIIYFDGPMGGKVISFKNIVSNDWNDQQNWVVEDVDVAQTPGEPNNQGNDRWIATMNPTCRIFPFLTFTTTPSTCGGSDGTATVDLTGISANNSVLWSDGQQQQTAVDLAAGTYSVTVTDNDLGCIYTDSTFVDNQGAATLSDVTSDETCPGACDGGTSITAVGGTGTLTYNWNTGQTGSVVLDLCPGIYSCTVSDENDCLSQISVTIDAAALINVASSSVDASCGNADGSATVDVTGSTGPYEILWDAAAANQVTPTASNLSAGSYVVTIKDVNDCEVTETVTVNNVGAATLSVSSTPVTCASACSGTATVVATGGTGTLDYLWDATAGNQTTELATNLCEGTYTCQVTDDNNCESFITVTVDPAPVVTLNGQVTNESCTSLCDGELAFQVSGATGNAASSYSLDGVTFTDVNASPIQNLCPGIYTLNVIDDIGCSDAIQFEISTDAVLDFGVSNDTLICEGETATLAVTGTGLSNIVWSTGSNDPSIQVSTETTTAYTVDFTQSGCNLQKSILVTTQFCSIPVEEQLQLPNIFTPDGDGKNDVYLPVFATPGVIVESFMILNRWGNVMIESGEISWDGKLPSGKEAVDGTYFYKLIYNFKGQEQTTLHGFIQLVRK
ncbi:MAG: hypothetical protein EP338_08550 [Bacteroidetes bacterium]|nr:MAG: hypothetical protein EP338_08550 [Bacteroidota bacterium]